MHPSLAKADVGRTMSFGASIAIQASEITLVSGDLMGIVKARKLSTQTMKNIRQNLSFLSLKSFIKTIFLNFGWLSKGHIVRAVCL